jgi:YidC/Oxa1 family membrane protein insertase
MEPRRIALAVILMAAVLVLTPILFPTAPPAPGAGGVATDSVTVGATPGTGAVGATTDRPGTADAKRPGVPGAPAAVAPVLAPALADSPGTAPTVPIDTITVGTSRAAYRITNLGAALIGAELRQYQVLANRGRTRGGPVELARPGDRLLAYRLVVPGDTLRLDRIPFTRVGDGTDPAQPLRYDAEVGPHTVSIRYTFQPDSYRVNIAAVVQGPAENAFLLVDLPPGFRSAEADSTEDFTHLAYAVKPETRGADAVPFRSLDPGERRIEAGPLSWVVAKNKYFLVGVLAPPGQPGFAEFNATGGVRESKQATRAQGTVVVPLRAGSAALEAYLGPQEFTRLAAMGREFETANPYGGWLQGLVQPFATLVIRALLWMKGTLGLSYGWILVLFGIAVRIVLWPLNQKAMRSSIALQRVQPELQAIQAKHKGDPQKLQAEMMRVYKEHGMSPFSSLSGCLPMLIPLPVFFALFFVFQNTIEFRGVPFLWLPDISIKDPFYVLPILVAVTAVALSWIGMRGVKANEQQRLLMYMMPAMMLVIFLNMAAGLNLYYLVQNLASLPQQWLIARERGKGAPAVARG